MGFRDIQELFIVREPAGCRCGRKTFNFINHPNLLGIEVNPTSANFGRITGKSGATGTPPRDIQLSVRFVF